MSQNPIVDYRTTPAEYHHITLSFDGEVATLALVAIVFLVVMKDSLNWIRGTIGFFAVAIGLMIGIKIYKRMRGV